MWHILKRKLWMQRSELKMMLVMSGISLMMIMAFGGFGSGKYTPVLMVADLDQTAASAEFVEMVQKLKDYRVEIIDKGAGEQGVRENKALALLVLEKGFDKSLESGVLESISLISVKSDADIMVLEPLLESRYAQMYQWMSISDKIAAEAAAKGESFEQVRSETFAVLKENSDKTALNLEVESVEGGAERNAILMHSLIGFLIFFVAYSCVFGAIDILSERKQNTWQRLLVSPSSKFMMLLGNVSVAWILGLIQLGLIFFLGSSMFGIDFGGNLGQMYLVGAFFCLAMAGFGVFIASLAKSMAQVSALISVALTAFGMLGGCLWPLDLVSSQILIGLSKVIPHTYAVKALTALSQGGGISVVLPQIAVLLMMAGVFLIAGFTKLMSTEEQYQ